MHILIGLGAALALLYYWLLGHWFARVLMCILLVPAFGLGALASFATLLHEGAYPLALVGAVAGWAAGSAPVWYWRQRIEAEASRYGTTGGY